MVDNRLVVLKLDGDLETNGLTVTLEVATEDDCETLYFPDLSRSGTLPPSPSLAEALDQWQQDYGNWTQNVRKASPPASFTLQASARALTPYKIQVSGSVHPLVEACQEASQSLVTLFKQWLHTDSFLGVEGALRGAVDRQSAVRVLIQTSLNSLHLLPWHQWSFVQDYPKAEVAIGAREFDDDRAQSPTPHSTEQINILAILGNDDNIDLGADEGILNDLSGATIKFLVQPSLEEFTDHLYKQSWDILFFAGHSDTEDGRGIIQLNPTTMLTIQQVEYGVKRAIANGLQLAIFNSCNGVGLAHALAELQLPQMIVMRQAVPDHVAHIFLKHFLDAFSQGTSFYQAERQARERLQSLEQDFPCASWLPMIYQNPAKVPPSWRSLCDPLQPSTPPQRTPPPPESSFLRKVGTVAIASLVATSLVLGVRSLGWLQSLELGAFDQFLRLRPSSAIQGDRIVVVGVHESDIQYQDEKDMERRGSLSDEALAQLLQKLHPHQPRLIGLDIFHDFAFEPSVQSHLTAAAPLIGICTFAETGNNQVGTAPPPKFTNDQLGFSDIPADPGYVVRRQILGMSSDDTCPTTQSLSFRMALAYLEQEGVSLNPRYSSEPVQIGDTIVPRIDHTSGGYQLSPEDVKGYQILVNYRAESPTVMGLADILEGSLDDKLAELVGDRIVLIGVVNDQDAYQTPYSQGRWPEKMPGVLIQAQMTSQLLSAVLDQQTLIWWWSDWGEGLWIASWALVGGCLVVWERSGQRTGNPMTRRIILINVLGIGCIIGGCFIVLLGGGWIPVVPSILVLTLTNVGVVAYERYWFQTSTAPIDSAD